MTHALISNEPTQVPTPRFCGDPRVLKYFDIYASQDDLLVEHGSADGNRNLASPLSSLLPTHILAFPGFAPVLVRNFGSTCTLPT
jgi:hypothetical protein